MTFSGFTPEFSGFTETGQEAKPVFFKFDSMQIKEIYVRWIGIPILAVIMAMVFGLDEGQIWWQKYLESLMYCAFYWNGACLMFFFFRRRFPLIRQTPKRLSLTTLSLLTFLLVGDFVICSFLKIDVANWRDYELLHSIPALIAGTVIGLIYEAVYFFQQWKHTIQVNESLKSQQLRTQFEVLQNQMSPHFLFNSLNTLTALIPEDSDIAVEFTQKLSEVYRYILQNRDRELVNVEEELAFVEAYVFLLKMRFPENLNVEVEVAPDFRRRYIAPLTLQMLVENAIKHNIVSRTHPLYIHIYVENGKSIIVKNNLQKKTVVEKSTKTGLANIQKRYELLGNKNIDIITTAQNFMVAVPLIDVVQQREYELVTE